MKKKNFIQKILDKLDQKMEQKAKCCCCDEKKNKQKCSK